MWITDEMLKRMSKDAAWTKEVLSGASKSEREVLLSSPAVTERLMAQELLEWRKGEKNNK